MLVREVPWRDPTMVFPAWANRPGVVWLDSAAQDARSRYSYLCAEPFLTLSAAADQVTVDGMTQPGDLLTLLAGFLDRHRSDAEGPVPFTGGAVGFLGYELPFCADPHVCRHPATMPDACFGLYDTVIGFDHQDRRCWIMSSGLPEPPGPARQARAARRADECARRLNTVLPWPEDTSQVHWRPELSEAEYAMCVRRVLANIRAGDIYQANFTMRFRGVRPPGLSLPAVYRRLRTGNPAPFAAYLAGPEASLLSASPERFLRLDRQGRIEARPIKGTRARHPDPVLDLRAAEALRGSGKDRTENLMIVDLLRNDLARVARIGSVRVPSLRTVESFATVHHLVSSVTATLKPGLGPVDLLRASMPGGSVTGAPKVRAMQIIDELEPARRGPYCGCLTWIGFDGAMDSSIIIRTLVATRTELIAQAGGGIVAESEPNAEYAEMLLKADPLLRAAAG